MNSKDRKRLGIIIHELARMSRNSWRDAKPCDYLPLEAEMRALLAKQN